MQSLNIYSGEWTAQGYSVAKSIFHPRFVETTDAQL